MKNILLIICIICLTAGCGGGSNVDKNLVATCSDGFKEYEHNCATVCSTHGGVRQFGLKGADCARQPPP